MSKRKIIGFICLFIAFVLVVLAFALPNYEIKEPDKDKEPEYNGKDAVILGCDDYLFRAYGAKSTELDDFRGALLTDSELNRIVSALADLNDKFSESSCKTLFVFIPSKMATYRDKLPKNVAETYSENRKYTQLFSALSGTGLDTLDIYGEFEKTKNDEQLYGTAADTVNELGGFRITEAVMTHLNEKYMKNKTPYKVPQLSEYTVETSEDDTSPLTREYRNITGETINNRLVSLIENSVKYKDVDYKYKADYATEIPYADREEGYSYASLLVLDTGSSLECDKFFSAVSSVCVYSKTVNANETITESFSPKYAVIMINENDIASLPKKADVIHSDGEQSAEPVILETAYSNPGNIVLFGMCEEHTTVKVKGGENDVSVRTESGEFVIEVPILQNDESYLSISCLTDGKTESEPVSQKVKYTKMHGDKGVIIGKDGHLHYYETIGDYTGETLLSDDTVAQYVGYLNAKADRIHAVSPNTKIIYVVPPNHLTIYPETAPDSLVSQKCDNSRLKQLVNAFKGNEKIAFLDLTSALLEAKKTAPYRLYNKTDTHWNELGAYYAYREIMNFVAKDYPKAAPEPLESFNVFTRRVAGGDMANFLNVDLNVVTEEGVYVRSKTELKSGISKDYAMNFANAWFSDYHEFNIGGKGLPTLLMYRDSFSTNLMSFLAEKFSHSVFYTMWERPDDLDAIAEMQPDYIIYEFVERSLGGLS